MFLNLSQHKFTVLFYRNIFSFRYRQTIEELYKKSIILLFLLPGGGDKDIRPKEKHPTPVTSKAVARGNLCKRYKKFLVTFNTKSFGRQIHSPTVLLLHYGTSPPTASDYGTFCRIHV